MSVPVLTAVTDTAWEERLVRAFESGRCGVHVVRRCVDVADLLAAAATGSARAALLSGDLRRLDGEAVGRLAAGGVTVVGVVPDGDEPAERRLRQLGVGHVLATGTAPEQVGAAVASAVATAGARPPDDPPGPDADADPPGRVVAVWGPTGAPGRTTVAAGLAAELAALGSRTLLVDADPYGGTVAQLLGLLDEAPGVAAAARLANQGALDVPALARLARTVSPDLAVLTGIARADRWPELRASSLAAVFAAARRLAAHVVVDCGFCLEQDEELTFDHAVARRNGATIAAIEEADVVVAVGSADVVSTQRLVRGLAELRDVRPGVVPVVVVNRLRDTGPDGAELTAALERYAGVAPAALLPLDVAGTDAALRRGETLPEAAPSSPLREALRAFAAALSGVPEPVARKRRRRR